MRAVWLVITLSEVAVDERRQLRLGDGADLGGLDAAVLEQHQGRDAADAIFRRSLGVLVDVELGDLELAVVFPGNFFEHRRNHLAWAAPLRPVVDQHRAIGLEYFLLKTVVSNIDDSLTHTELPPLR